MATRSSGASKNGPKKASSKQKSAGASHTEQGSAQSQTTEQPIGAIMTKGLELAEAGLNLGINLVHKFGSSMQDQMLDTFAKGGMNLFKPASSQSAEAETAAEHAHRASKKEDNKPHKEQPDHFEGIYSRLPAFPGGDIKISFSINNESISRGRQVAIFVESDLIGELTNAAFNSKHLSVNPAKTTIAPADFEKFTITGKVPVEQKSDQYRGAIIVDGEERMRIPLKISIIGYPS